jgi:hypothetical protein
VARQSPKGLFLQFREDANRVGELVGNEPDGQMHGPGLVREDRAVIEEEVD